MLTAPPKEVAQVPDGMAEQPASAGRTGTWHRALFTCLLLSSGFCGISYEILYGRMLGNLIGDQFIVSASVLLTFLLGIGVGSYYAHRLWPHLWLLEAGIGLYAVAFAMGTGLLDALLYSDFLQVRSGLAGPLLVCVVLLLVPSFLIGTSLPIFAGYSRKLLSGSAFSGVYAIYNLGAAATVLLIEFWLIRSLGIRSATLCIATLNGLIAVALVQVFDFLRAEAPDSQEPLIRFPRRHLGALALASVASAIFQLLMIKVAEAFIGPFRETFALVLCVTLLGIATGSALTRWFKVSFPGILVANLASMIWLIASFGYVTQLYASLHPVAAETYFGSVALKLGTLGLLMGLPSLTFGATIPALITSQGNIARGSGQLLFVSSLANACGFLLMAFYLHQRFDYGVLIVVIAVLVTAALVLYRSKIDHRLVAGVVLCTLAFQFKRSHWDEELLYLGHASFLSTESFEGRRGAFEFPEKFKGPEDVFAITWSNGRPHFFINGYISIDLTSPYEKMVGGVSSVFAPRSDDALVLGVGSGATASTVGQVFDHTDAVEINGTVLENLFRMKDYNFDIESNPKVTIVHDDAIHYVKSSREKYSLIVNTTTTPLYFSSSKLYTTDFIAAVKERLRPDGVYATWIDGRVGNRGVDITLNTLEQSFNHCALVHIRSAYLLLLCSQEPLQPHQPMIVADDPVISSYLRDSDIHPEWLAYGLVHPRAMDLVDDPTTPLNTLDYPALEFEMSQLRERGITEFLNRVADGMSISSIEEVLAPALDWNPMYLAFHAQTMLKNARLTRRWIQLVLAEVPDLEEQWEQLDPKSFAENVEMRVNLFRKAQAMMKEKDYPQAIGVLSLLLEIDPKRDNAYMAIGMCYEHMARYRQALKGYLAELRVDPGDIDAPYMMARVYVKMGEFDHALSVLDELVKVNQKAEVHYTRGKAYEGLKDIPKALQAYREALQKDPASELAGAAVRRLERSRSAGRR